MYNAFILTLKVKSVLSDQSLSEKKVVDIIKEIEKIFDVVICMHSGLFVNCHRKFEYL